ncbi:UDP-glucose 4-epimerase family protein [Vibrio hepatarius]|uniref:UDP-glucose 4-epimerase family protein n=1 Tax=Vibrio hepatarius TaxID=171383 RepID=UPI00142DC825|nr:SDR family oxidoreductase [Vibrio hepatarius]NIY83300.1 SDR family oxidoreductase [Vibrio hepatarius]
MNNLLVTGYSGFVGSHFLKTYGNSDNVNLLGRSTPPQCSTYLNASIDTKSDYYSVLTGMDVVVHIAARVHVMKDTVRNPLEEYREVNTCGTINLARQAAKVGVKRFIFLSSIKVNGDSTSLDWPFTYADAHAPGDDYGLSKSEAEQQLFDIGKESGMEIVVIRPPLVYGPGVKANFASLMNLVAKGVPLPFGCIHNNRRSLVSIVNLVDLMMTCIDHPKAANQVFLVSDGHDISTSDMVKKMANAIGKPIWQLPIPVWGYRMVGNLFGKSDVVDRLVGSLQVDISHTKETLGWKPPQSIDDGFKETAKAFLRAKEK